MRSAKVAHGHAGNRVPARRHCTGWQAALTLTVHTER